MIFRSYIIILHNSTNKFSVISWISLSPVCSKISTSRQYRRQTFDFIYISLKYTYFFARLPLIKSRISNETLFYFFYRYCVISYKISYYTIYSIIRIYIVIR
nr:MAG TPA: hypothetical protein [Caudoviricetes sp.]